MKQFKLIIRGKNKGHYQRVILDLLNISNHHAFTCNDGAGVDGLTISQLHTAIDYICNNYPNLTLIVK